MKLIPQLRLAIRRKHYSYVTEKTYVYWVKHFIKFHRLRHPREMGVAEIREFMNYLAAEKTVAASTQNQALNALVFLYKHVLQLELGDFGVFLRAKKSKYVPVVLSKREVTSLLRCFDKDGYLLAALLYGTGMRLKECLSLRVKDLDFDRGQIYIHAGKGAKGRIVPLPNSLVQPIDLTQSYRISASAPTQHLISSAI